MAGGNPSANGTSVGVTESIEGLPVFALKFWGPSCQWQANGGTKVPLGGGAAYTKYANEKTFWEVGNYLQSQSCSVFANANPTRADYFSQLSNAVIQQVPYDGLQSNISLYDAGMLSAADLTDTSKVQMYKGTPVCGQFVSYRAQYGFIVKHGITSAASQLHPLTGGPATNVYINTNANALKLLSQATIVHEALHNLTGLNDEPLELLLGLDPNGSTQQEIQNGTNCFNGNTICISNQLRNQGCTGPN